MKRQPRITSLGYTLLSLLARRRRTGYELSRFTAPPRNVALWSANHSNIYKELARLTEHDYVRFRTVKQARPQDKKIYSITAQGLERLRRWAIEQPRPEVIRRELNIKVHAAWLVDPTESAKLFRRQSRESREQIDKLSTHWNWLQRGNGLTAPPRPPHPLFGTQATIKLEIAYRKVLIEWCNWVERSLTRTVRRATRRTTRSATVRSRANRRDKFIHAALEE